MQAEKFGIQIEVEYPEDKIGKLFVDNKESYFQVKYMDITMPGKDGVTMEKRGNVVLLKNITEFQELDTAKTTNSSAPGINMIFKNEANSKWDDI